VKEEYLKETGQKVKQKETFSLAELTL